MPTNIPKARELLHEANTYALGHVHSLITEALSLMTRDTPKKRGPDRTAHSITPTEQQEIIALADAYPEASLVELAELAGLEPTASGRVSEILRGVYGKSR